MFLSGLLHFEWFEFWDWPKTVKSNSSFFVFVVLEKVFDAKKICSQELLRHLGGLFGLHFFGDLDICLLNDILKQSGCNLALGNTGLALSLLVVVSFLHG